MLVSPPASFLWLSSSMVEFSLVDIVSQFLLNEMDGLLTG